MKTRLSKGFTLIELLVVIAIIGILSSIVLASLNTARAKGANAAIRTSLAQLRTQANLYYNDNFNFGTLVGSCAVPANTVFSDSRFSSIVTTLQNEDGGTLATCLNNITGSGSWAVWVPSKPDGSTNYLCTDATGIIKPYNTAPTLLATAVCP